MIENHQILLNVAASSMLISGWCVGIRTACKNKMLLAPIFNMLVSWAEARKRIKINNLKHRIVYANKANDKETLYALQAEIDKIDDALTWRDYIVKPLLTCVTCMASVHGLFLHFMLLVLTERTCTVVYGFSAVLSIIFSIYLNTLLWGFLKNDSNGKKMESIKFDRKSY